MTTIDCPSRIAVERRPNRIGRVVCGVILALIAIVILLAIYVGLAFSFLIIPLAYRLYVVARGTSAYEWVESNVAVSLSNGCVLINVPGGARARGGKRADVCYAFARWDIIKADLVAGTVTVVAKNVERRIAVEGRSPDVAALDRARVAFAPVDRTDGMRVLSALKAADSGAAEAS